MPIRAKKDVKTTAAGRRLVRSIQDAAVYLNGDHSVGRVVYPKPVKVDIAAVRAKTGLSQAEFARKFMISPGALSSWEQGLREPEGAARLLLAVIARAPDVVSQVADELAKR